MEPQVERPNEQPEAPQAEPSGTAGQETSGPELREEVQRLVESLTRAVRAAWNSEQRRQIERQVQQGLRTLVGEVEELLKKVQESEEGQELRERAEQMVARVRSSKLTAEVQEGLLKGLHTLADELQELADRLETQAQSREPGEEGPEQSSPPPQDIPVSGQNQEEDQA